jgi:hypothetical protein
LHLREEKRVKENRKWPKPKYKEECRRPASAVGEGRKEGRKTKVERKKRKKTEG